MADNTTDRNLLIGIIALQMEFVDREQLISAMHAWVADKSRSLDHVLLSQGSLNQATRDVLVAVVDQRLSLHEGDATKGLATVTTPLEVQRALQEIGDDKVEQSLMRTIDSRSGGAGDAKAAERKYSSTGRYRLIRHHAKGGLGEVFVAQDEELNREVAVKEIQLEHASDLDCRARFLREAEITGGLEHPSIVPVYGMGQYQDGRPFYAMRYIQGGSLRDAIGRFHGTHEKSRDGGFGEKSGNSKEDRSNKGSKDQAGTGPQSQRTERVLTFRNLVGRVVSVCQAIEYAHSRGVVHRDIKPSNIMLGRFGETLIVDWGLAKPVGTQDLEPTMKSDKTLRPQSGSGSTPTQMGAAIGTPAYMSPEQASGRHDKLTPASDIYGIGATLYCLLTGRPPFQDGDMGSVLQQVIHGEFEPPRRIRQNVPKPLEAVCLKCMARKPDDRYESAADLARDLERWLADEPVEAHPEKWHLRLRRFAIRHQAAVAGCLATVLVTMAAMTFVAINVGLANQELSQLNETILKQSHALQATNKDLEQARSVAETERVSADQKRVEAEQTRDQLAVVVNFLEGMFLAADPIGANGLNFTPTTKPRQELTARDILQMGEAKLDALASSPRVQAALMTSIANSYRSLAFLDDASRLLNGAVEICRQALDPDDPDYAETLHYLGWLKHDMGQYDEAEDLYRQALDIRTRKLGEYDLETAETMFQLAWLLADISETEESEALFRRVVEIRKQELGPDHRYVGTAWAGLIGGMLSGDLAAVTPDRLNEILNALNEAVRIFTLNEGDNNVGTALLAFQDAELQHRVMGDQAKAEESYNKSIDLTSEIMGPRHPWVALGKHELATLMLDRQRNVEAESLLREALSICADSLPDFHPKVGIATSTLAIALERQGKLAESEKAYLKSAEIFTELMRRLPERDQVRAKCVLANHEVARVQLRQNRLDEALQSANLAFEIAQESDGNTLPNLYVLRLIGEIHEAAKRPEEEIATLEEGLQIAKEMRDEDPDNIRALRETAYFAYRLADAMIREDRPEEAIEYLMQDRQITERLIELQPFRSQNRSDLIDSEELLFNAYLANEQHEEARDLMLDQMTRVRKRANGLRVRTNDRLQLAQTLQALASVELILEDRLAAVGHLKEAQSVLDAIEDEQFQSTIDRRLMEIRARLEDLK